jgi:holliday junction DNA helicase RuvA
MIGRLAGRLLEKTPPTVVVDVQGVGYEVDVPMSTFCNLPAMGQSITLHIHQVVREDAVLLFGFGTEGERRAFRQLLKISGIGPRMALALLSGMSVQDLADAVASQESARLTRVPGIGKKTAERILLELKDRIDWGTGVATDASGGDSAHPDIVKALAALGYNEREAQKAVERLPDEVSVADGIRQALKSLSKV